MRLALALALLVACRDEPGHPSEPPENVVGRALELARSGDAVAFARTLSTSLRGGARSERQLGTLAWWLQTRAPEAIGLPLVTLAGWEAPRTESSTPTTATVVTVLRLRAWDSAQGAAREVDRALPLAVDVIAEDGAWRIGNARIAPVPDWLVPERNGDAGPPDLAAIADTFRPSR